MARKVSVPGQPELGMGAVAPGGVLLLNQPVVRALGLTESDLAPHVEREREKMERRLRHYRDDGMPDVEGHIVIIVDDGLATGVTAAAAIQAVRRLEPARIVLAVPVCARQTADLLADAVEDIVCVAKPESFHAVGLWYRDFSQTTDAEVIDLLEKAREATGTGRPEPVRRTLAGATNEAAPSGSVSIDVGGLVLSGDLNVPDGACGVVLFAHGSGSSRFSARNRAVARYLQQQRLATLLFDLLTAEEEKVDQRTRHLRFDIPLLARRVAGAARWLTRNERTRDLAIGAFGASTGGGAALLAAADHPDLIAAVVSRGGRPDLAGDALARVEAPTLLVVGSRDPQVLEMNRSAMAQMGRAEVDLHIVSGATHLFEEPGTLDEVARVTAQHFLRHLGGTTAASGTEVKQAEHAAEVYRTPAEVADLIAFEAEPFGDLDAADLSALLDRIGDARVVCIGEASHGTSEFYRLRARITQALIQEKGFTVVAAEADWPDAERVDAYVRHRDARETEWEAFSRFPTWMWRNEEVLGFVEWLRVRNQEVRPSTRAGFFGLDLYSLYTSIAEVLRYLDARDPKLAEAARSRYACLAPFVEDPARYGRAVVSQRYRDCEDEVVAMLQDLLQQRLRLTAGDNRAQRDGAFPFFDAAQNARLVRDAEAYYRAMFYGNVSTWNLRDLHMMETLLSLLDFFGETSGKDTKAVVWAHNSHLGDAAATQMGTRGEINVGHLCRRVFGDEAYLIGFGTHTGTVMAARDWGGDAEVMRVRPSHEQSYERLCHASDIPRFFLPLRHGSGALRHELGAPHLERAIGVVYRPDTERQSHYFLAELPRQFDEYVWLDETAAVAPLAASHAPALPYPHPFELLVD